MQSFSRMRNSPKSRNPLPPINVFGSNSLNLRFIIVPYFLHSLRIVKEKQYSIRRGTAIQKLMTLDLIGIVVQDISLKTGNLFPAFLYKLLNCKNLQTQ